MILSPYESNIFVFDPHVSPLLYYYPSFCFLMIVFILFIGFSINIFSFLLPLRSYFFAYFAAFCNFQLSYISSQLISGILTRMGPVFPHNGPEQKHETDRKQGNISWLNMLSETGNYLWLQSCRFLI